MYNLREYSDNYPKISGNLWQYFKDQSNATSSDPESFKSKIKITKNILADDNTKNVETEEPLNHLSNFLTFEMSLFNCEINFILTYNYTGAGTFTITDTELYVSVVTL